VSYRVGYFVPSLSSTSVNRVLAHALIRLAPGDLEFAEIPIGDCRSIRYSPEVFQSDGEVTDAATAEFLRAFMAEFRDHIARVLAVLPRP
jgi:hypothetical protein